MCGLFILCYEPLFVALLSRVFLCEKVIPTKALTLAIALTGTALTVNLNPEGG